MLTGSAIVPRASAIMLALGAVLLPGCTLEQIQFGQLYRIFTPAQGACPQLEWRFVVYPQRSINGYLARNEVSRIASLSGVLNPDDSFQMTLTDLTGSGKAEVSGRFTSLISTIAIHGDAAGSACDGQTYNLRIGGYLAFPGGTVDGGGR